MLEHATDRRIIVLHPMSGIALRMQPTGCLECVRPLCVPIPAPSTSDFPPAQEVPPGTPKREPVLTWVGRDAMG